MTLMSSGSCPNGVRVPASAVGLRGLMSGRSVGGLEAPFALNGPLRRAVFFARYCPSNATELFSMCSNIPGTIEPVLS
jgi:hypothetical protein